MMSKPSLHFVENLPAPERLGAETVLIYDRRLERAVPGFASWTRGFSARMPVTAGEGLKDLRAFPAHCERLLKTVQNLSARRLTIVVAGGGSVGDFGGFIASVFKRGVRLVQMPTTWLAAIDSAHGGKTALNVRGGKNQIGTFYQADEIFLVAKLLGAQPEARAVEALGELAKIALIDGRPWVRKFERVRGERPGALLLRFLRDAIAAKYRVVKRDPLEKSGARQVLNLGHTFGHVLEAQLGLAHGVAVAQGLFFALEWSRARGDLRARDFARAQALLTEVCGLDRLAAGRLPTVAQARRLLVLDKKRAAAGQVTFVFLRGFGRPVRRDVAIDEVLKELARQRWVK